jgi:TonB family protein
MTFATLVLLPALAVSGSMASAAAVGKPAETPAVIGTMNSASHASIQQSVVARFSTGSFLEAALHQGGTLEYSFKGNAPIESTAPKVTKAVEVELSQQELSEQPNVANVVVKAIVDENGVPRNVTIAQSAGPTVDKKAIAAVSQYRFKPATIDNQPTWSNVSITIKIQKQ